MEDFTQMASTNRQSLSANIKLSQKEIEEDRKLLVEGQGGCCRL